MLTNQGTNWLAIGPQFIGHYWLVDGFQPLWKIWVRQLGWLFHSQLNGKIKNTFQSPPTSWYLIVCNPFLWAKKNEPYPQIGVSEKGLSIPPWDLRDEEKLPVIDHYLVVFRHLPLWKMMEWVRQLGWWGWWHSIPNWMESHHPFMFQSPTRRFSEDFIDLFGGETWPPGSVKSCIQDAPPSRSYSLLSLGSKCTCRRFLERFRHEISWTLMNYRCLLNKWDKERVNPFITRVN